MSHASERSVAADVPWALGVSYLLVTFGVFFGLPSQPEHELQLFMSSHYRDAPLSLWDSRWYGGFQVTWHPPLLYTVVALLGRIVGLERGYAAVVVATGVGVMLALWAFARELRERTTSGTPLAALALAVSPVLNTFLFPLGQTPFLFSCALALGGGSALLRFFRTREDWTFVAGVGALAAAPLAHPLGVTIVTAALALALARARREGLWLWLLAAAVVVSIDAVALQPFIAALRGLDGDKLALGKLSLAAGVGLAWAGAAFAVVCVGVALSGNRTRLVQGTAAASAVLLLCAGLQVPTQIPDDKLLALAVLAAAACLAVAEVGPRARSVSLISSALAFLVTAHVLGSHGAASASVRNHKGALREVQQVLSRSTARGLRYMTVGLGNERFELSRSVQASLLDGGLPWNTRTVSGARLPYPSLDALPLQDDAAAKVFTDYLDAADALRLRWVVSAEPSADALLKAHGFRLAAAWSGGVVLWERDATAVAGAPDARNAARAGGWALVWALSGVICLLLVLIALARAALGLVLQRDREDQAQGEGEEAHR